MVHKMLQLLELISIVYLMSPDSLVAGDNGFLSNSQVIEGREAVVQLWINGNSSGAPSKEISKACDNAADTNLFSKVDNVVKVSPLELVWIAKGKFLMGSGDSEVGRRENEGPQTAVTIGYGFWMGKYEVTVDQLNALFSRGGAHTGSGELHAAANEVTWNEAREFCRRVNGLERARGRVPDGYEYRLPTEAEWEYTCRAGTVTRYSCGEDILESFGWFGELRSNNERGPKHVGYKMANPWGLYDMHGNVKEWCSDCLRTPYAGGTVTNPVGKIPPDTPVFRGGSWYSPSVECRSAWRHYIERRSHVRDTALWDVGFRVVLAPALQE